MITIDNRRSLSGRAAMSLMRLAAKTFLSGSRDSTAEKEIEKGRRVAERSRFTLPKDRKADYSTAVIADHPCLCMRRKGQGQRSRKAVLYLHGGLQDLWKSEISIARGYMNDTGYDLWYPIYPSPTAVPILESIQVCYECYKQMAAVYGAENTSIVGSSFGGYYALQILNQINLRADNVPMPALVIALSPNGIPDSEEDLNHMKALSEKDPMLSFQTVRLTEEIAKWYDKETPDYTVYPILEDFRNAPETYIYYGEETVFGNAACYQRAFDRSGCGEKLHILMQKGMMHDYACMPVFPESKRAYKEQISLITQSGQSCNCVDEKF